MDGSNQCPTLASAVECFLVVTVVVTRRNNNYLCNRCFSFRNDRDGWAKYYRRI